MTALGTFQTISTWRPPNVLCIWSNCQGFQKGRSSPRHGNGSGFLQPSEVAGGSPTGCRLRSSGRGPAGFCSWNTEQERQVGSSPHGADKLVGSQTSEKEADKLNTWAVDEAPRSRRQVTAEASLDLLWPEGEGWAELPGPWNSTPPLPGYREGARVSPASPRMEAHQSQSLAISEAVLGGALALAV